MMMEPIEVEVGEYLGEVYIDAADRLVLTISGAPFTQRSVEAFLSQPRTIRRIV